MYMYLCNILLERFFLCYKHREGTAVTTTSTRSSTSTRTTTVV